MNRELQRKRRQKKRRRRRLIRVITVYIIIICVLIFFGTLIFRGGKWLLKQGTDYFTKTEQSEEAAEEVLAQNIVYIDKELHNQLIDMSREEPKIDTILSNLGEYPESLLELVLKNPETLDFVLDYPNRKNQETAIDIENDYKKGEVPLLLQWDKRWGYDSYGERMIAVNGCGPTSLSMVAVYLTGDTSYNPKKVAEFSQKEGYLDENANTAWDLMTTGAAKLGLRAREIPLDEVVMSNELQKGNLIICSVGKGDFTETGHFIVLTGYQGGMFTVNDPNSIIRSSERWYYSTLSPQIKNLWSFSI